MSQLKLSLILISLTITRLAIADGIPWLSQEEKHREEQNSSYSINITNNLATNSKDADFRALQDFVANLDQPEVSTSTILNQPKSRKSRKEKINGNGNKNQVLTMFSTLIENFDKIDMKRLFTETMSQVQKGKIDFNDVLSTLTKRRSFDTTTARSYGINDTMRNAKPKINGSAILAEGDNLLSITKQLVKLARTGFVGNEYPPSHPVHHINSGNMAGLLNPLIGVPSMMNGATHSLQSSADESGDHGSEHHHHAAARGDMFWVVMPALIAVGAGVIVVPLIAAWLISSTMNQNTMTVAAGKRRRRRDVLDQILDPLSLESTHAGLFRMLDIHRILEDAPDLVIAKLSRLHDALDSVNKYIINSADLNKPNPFLGKPSKSTEKSIKN